jgi:hypothetical protein
VQNEVVTAYCMDKEWGSPKERLKKTVLSGHLTPHY